MKDQFDNIAFCFSTPIQVRFKDIDKLGHVNNATLLTYVETARVHYFNVALGDKNNWDETGVILARTEIDYLVPVFLHDNIKVYTHVSKFGNKSFDITNRIVKRIDDKEVICANAKSVMVCMDYRKRAAFEIPDDWKLAFNKTNEIKNDERF
jgi:acyl-CoA thioester hydrolase